jgi:hypothetical protein
MKRHFAKGFARIDSPTVPSGVLLHINREISLSGKIIHCTTPETALDAWYYQHQSAHFVPSFSAA